MSGIPASLGVVILGYGDPEPAAALAERVVAEGAAPGQVLVVHNGAAPGAPWPGRDDVEVLHPGANLGYAGGMNRGVASRLARGDGLLLLLTHDASFETGAIAALADAAQRHPEVGLLGPRLDDPRRGVVFSFGVRVGPTGGTHHVHEPPPESADVVACDSIDGSFMLVRAGPSSAPERSTSATSCTSRRPTSRCASARRPGVARRGRAARPRRAGERRGRAAGASSPTCGCAMAWSSPGARRAGSGWSGGLGRVAMYLAMYGRRIVDPRRSRPAAPPHGPPASASCAGRSTPRAGGWGRRPSCREWATCGCERAD